MKINKIIKPKRFSRFVIVPSAIFRFKNISAAATGLYCWLFSHDENQDITFSFIMAHFKNGRDALQTCIKELTAAGFMIREQVKIDGKFKGYNYILNDAPLTGKPLTGKPLPGNQQQSNIYIDNIYNNKSNIKHDIRVLNAFEHFVKLFPEKNQPKTEAQKTKWLSCLDKIQRIDGYDLGEVYLKCKELRNDSFWQNNFLSILKLRNVDKNGVKYIDRFMYKKNVTINDIRKKIPGHISFYKYNDPNGKTLVGAKTINGDIDYMMLQTMLKDDEIKIILNEL
jgi:hypothetical protein